MQVALVSWAMQRVAAAGFLPHGTPDLVRATVLEKCGFQPRGDNTQVRSTLPRHGWDWARHTWHPTRHLPALCLTVVMTMTGLQP